MKKSWIILIILIAIGAVFFLLPGLKNSEGVLEPTDDPEAALELALSQNKPIFIEFFAERCPVCVKMEPIIQELKDEYGDRVEFIIADTDGSGLGLAIDYQVMYIPAYLFIDDQGVQQGEILSGFMPKAALEKLIKNLL